MHSLRRPAIRTTFSLAFILGAIYAFGQNQAVGPSGEGSFIAGPQGVPRMVLNESGSWSQPLVVFRNKDLELIIPDIRTTGWAASYANAFKREGTYLTYLYLYGVKTHRTVRELLYVNTRTKIAVILRNAVTPPTRVDLCKPDPSMPIDRIRYRRTSINQLSRTVVGRRDYGAEVRCRSPDGVYRS